MIGGLIKTENQIIEFNNKKQQIDEKFGYVFQTSRLLPWLTVKENVALVCENKSRDNERIDEILESFGLKDFINYYPKAISGGDEKKGFIGKSFYQ